MTNPFVLNFDKPNIEGIFQDNEARRLDDRDTIQNAFKNLTALTTESRLANDPMLTDIEKAQERFRIYTSVGDAPRAEQAKQDVRVLEERKAKAEAALLTEDRADARARRQDDSADRRLRRQLRADQLKESERFIFEEKQKELDRIAERQRDTREAALRTDLQIIADEAAFQREILEQTGLTARNTAEFKQKIRKNIGDALGKISDSDSTEAQAALKNHINYLAGLIDLEPLFPQDQSLDPAYQSPEPQNALPPADDSSSLYEDNSGTPSLSDRKGFLANQTGIGALPAKVLQTILGGIETGKDSLSSVWYDTATYSFKDIPIKWNTPVTTEIRALVKELEAYDDRNSGAFQKTKRALQKALKETSKNTKAEKNEDVDTRRSAFGALSASQTLDSNEDFKWGTRGKNPYIISAADWINIQLDKGTFETPGYEDPVERSGPYTLMD